MKRFALIGGLCTFFLLMLRFPNACFAGAASGLLLWFQTVLPTLFPFLVITSLLVQTRAMEGISRIIAPVLCPIFRVSRVSSFAILGGFLCGYPVGAKLISDLLDNGYISKREGNYLLSFCNNTSPMFVISYLACQNLHEPRLGIPSLIIVWFSPVLLSFLFRRIWSVRGSRRANHLTVFRQKGCSRREQMLCKHKESRREQTLCKQEKNRREERFDRSQISGQEASEHSQQPRTFASALDYSIMSACESIMKVGGYIIVFSIVLELCRLLPLSGFFWEMLCLPSLEITSGIQTLCGASLSFPMRYSLTLALVSFGGFCAVFQTQCMVQRHKLSLAAYTLEKLGTAMVSSLLALIYIYLS
ncbi:nucleoside recognition domain-containing protein [Roseburia hominis]